MAQSRSKFSAHTIHSFLQHRKLPGLWLAAIAGLALGSLIVGHSWYQVSLSTAPSRSAQLARLQHDQSALANLKSELAAQKVSLNEMQASGASDGNGVSLAGFSDDDVSYWRKQMDAYSRMTGVQMDIIGIANSQFRNATMVVVKIDLNDRAAGSVDLIKALDFLQLYGYVQNFDGLNAVVHIQFKPA